MRRLLCSLLGFVALLGLFIYGFPTVDRQSIRAEPQAASPVSPTAQSSDGSSESESPSPQPRPSVSESSAPPYRPDLPKKSTRGFDDSTGQDFGKDAAAGEVASRDRFLDLPYNDWILPYGDWTGNHGGEYRFQDNVSVHDGMLDVHVRSIDGTNTGAAWIWQHPNPVFRSYGFTYGAVEQRVKVVGDLPGYGAANLLWPDSEDRRDGEIDFPESGFEDEPTAYHHCLGSRFKDNCSVFKTGVTWSRWHVYRIEWRPTGVSYYIDGRLIGTNTDAVPDTSHHWVTQMARDSAGRKDSELEGHYLVDWVRFEELDDK